ncbi:amidohydrolase family protein [Metabacillus iocasae]|uniref:TIM-barrel fold metal-dependent hydrolase n=1 Tax=Priestia iocasae TaxID=2291674 RepID=A0ABS2QRP4_9BACI|nr:amidohydrolase family protein [Metabacillus iocasae]MBM7702107.1 putative TIM-barrel fold metal-dependent hydrolase [Metabacillus iocasae]
MKVTLKDVPAIDVHAHPYEANVAPYTEVEYVRKLSLSVVSNNISNQTKRMVKQPFPGTNMWVQILIKRLSSFLGCEPTLEEVVAYRNRRATNFKQFTHELFQDANLTGIVGDFGYPQPPLTKEHYQDLCGVRMWEVYRIEPVMVRMSEQCDSFTQFVESYREDVRNELQKDGVIGLKSIIAYRSGLDIQEMNESKAKNDYATFKANTRAEAKNLRDYCLHIAMEECTKANKVMHIHTGIGDGDVILPKASPSFLLEMLRHEKYKSAKVHLVHGGYPWVEEAAFIVSILPNVYMDISLQNPFSGHGVKRILSQIFELAPFDKVMYGSDAFTMPEMNWLGVHLFKECFEEVLNEWVTCDYMDAETARIIGEMVLYRNFEHVYQDHLKGATS